MNIKMKKRKLNINKKIILLTTAFLIFSLIWIILLNLSFISGKLDFPYKEGGYTYNPEDKKDITEQETIENIFTKKMFPEKILAQNIIIEKGKDASGKEVYKITFKKDGKMNLGNQPPITDMFTFEGYKENSVILFNANGEILEAHVTAENKKFKLCDTPGIIEFTGSMIIINGRPVSFSEGTKLDYKENNVNLKIPDGGKVITQYFSHENSNGEEPKNLLFKYESSEKGGSFYLGCEKINLGKDDLKSNRYQYGIRVEDGAVYYSSEISFEKDIPRDIGNIYINDKVTIEGVDINPNKEKVSLKFLGEKARTEYRQPDSGNFFIFSEYALEKKNTISICAIAGDGNCAGSTKVGYKLDIIKDESSPPISLSFKEGNPIFTGIREDEAVSINVGLGENNKKGFGEIRIIEQAEKNPAVLTTGFNTFNFNGEVLYSGLGKDNKYEIYKQINPLETSKPAEGISITPYTQLYELIKEKHNDLPSILVRGSKKWELYNISDVLVKQSLVQYGDAKQVISNKPRVVLSERTTAEKVVAP